MTRVETYMAEVRDQEKRADAKAFQAFAGSITLLGLAGAGAAAVKPTGTIVICWVAIAVFLTLSLLFAASAFQPRLGGRHGFVQWANLGASRLSEELGAETDYDPAALWSHAERIGNLSRALVRRYIRISASVSIMSWIFLPAGIIIVDLAQRAIPL